MMIFIAILSALVFYIVLCFSMNKYFKTEIGYPKAFVFSEKNITVMCAVCAVISCIGLYLGTDSNPPYRSLMFYILFIFLACAAVIDIKKKIIPNRLVLTLFGIWTVYIILLIILSPDEGISELIKSITGALFSLLVFGAGYILMKNKLGGGDVKLTIVMGAVLTGDAVFGALIYALILSLMFAAIALISQKMKMKDSMPFAPFLFLGTAAAVAVM